MAPYLLTRTEKIPHTTICGKDYADCLLGLTRGNFGALHAQGEHCDQCNVCRSPQQSPVSCHQDQICGHLSTGVLLQHDSARPILPVQLLQQSKICSSSVFHIHCACQTSPEVIFTSLDHSKRGDGRQVFQVRRRGAAGGALVAALSTKILFLGVSVHFRSAGTLVWNAMKTT